MENKHLFTVFVDALLPKCVGDICKLQSDALWLRVVKVLRLRAQERLILFNKALRIEIKVSQETFSSKNILYGIVEVVDTVFSMQPSITLLQAITKRPAFEEIIYNAAQLGVETIVPIKTAKSTSTDFSLKELARFENIMIAACEQAKQFCIPKILPQKSLQEVLTTISSLSMKIVFDSTGRSCVDILSVLPESKEIVVLFGCEAGLNYQELLDAEQHGFNKIRLTPTILRSEDAPLLGIGMIRSFIV